MIKKIVFALIICSGVSILTDAGAILYAQKIDRSDISVFGRNHFGRILQVSDERLNDWYMAYEVAVGFDTDPSDSCQFAQTYGYPVLGVGISVSQLSTVAFALPSFYTDLYTVYGSFDRTLVSLDRWRAGYMLEVGITTNPGSYDPLDNPYNRVQSSPLMAYFGSGFFGEYLIGKHWSVGIEAMYRHQSNGKLSLPNSGIDVVGVGVIYGEDAASTAEYSSISVGIGLVHEFFWRNLAGHLTVGAYPYLKTGLGKDIQMICLLDS